MKSAFFRKLTQSLFGPVRRSSRTVHRRLVVERLGDRTPFDASGFASPEAPEGESSTVLPDFTLTDVNPNSGSYNQGVSSYTYFEQVTGWYFTHST